MGKGGTAGAPTTHASDLSAVTKVLVPHRFAHHSYSPTATPRFSLILKSASDSYPLGRLLIVCGKGLLSLHFGLAKPANRVPAFTEIGEGRGNLASRTATSPWQAHCSIHQLPSPNLLDKRAVTACGESHLIIPPTTTAVFLIMPFIPRLCGDRLDFYVMRALEYSR